MKKYALVLLLAAALPGAIMADHHEAKKVDVENYTCKEIMILDGSDREIAIAFLHGYLIGKSKLSEYDPQKKGEETDKFIDSCLDHPTAKAIKVLADSA